MDFSCDENLRLQCNTLFELDRYVANFGLSINHPAVVARRNELVADSFITDAATLRLLECCCSTLDELNNVVGQFGFDVHDPAVQARQHVLQVRSVT